MRSIKVPDFLHALAKEDVDFSKISIRDRSAGISIDLYRHSRGRIWGIARDRQYKVTQQFELEVSSFLARRYVLFIDWPRKITSSRMLIEIR